MPISSCFHVSPPRLHFYSRAAPKNEALENRVLDWTAKLIVRQMRSCNAKKNGSAPQPDTRPAVEPGASEIRSAVVVFLA